MANPKSVKEPKTTKMPKSTKGTEGTKDPEGTKENKQTGKPSIFLLRLSEADLTNRIISSKQKIVPAWYASVGKQKKFGKFLYKLERIK